ncbi:hypothetical protein OsJ_31954 [Oryza sativa Japonica Group]|uniref:Uncharacterized protein n=1 Tax=Oryza sativa subsp. japonica TaxID=39947 RepID=B9G6C5_ORYSJ|nr:hypothetical protein OsJ_31954 [Oryza sativa Japonica Group]
MVVIEQEPEVEETPAAAEEPAAEEQAAGGAAGGEAARADGEDEEEAFEDALTDEQLRECATEREREGDAAAADAVECGGIAARSCAQDERRASTAVKPRRERTAPSQPPSIGPTAPSQPPKEGVEGYGLATAARPLPRLHFTNIATAAAPDLRRRATMAAKLLLAAKARSQANDAKAEGNKFFGAGEYERALSQYETALQIAAELESAEDIRSACHSNRAVCFLKLGKYDETIKECTKALELNPSYLKALLRRGEAHEKLEHYDEAIADMKKIIELDPSNEQAKRSLFRLEPLAAEKREKMKEEMIGKLKDLGNSVLGRFGMSVDNFKAVKDPNTGSYSISFQQ